MNTLLITGGTGFLGSHLINRLLELDFKIVVAKRKNSNLNKLFPFIDKIEFVDVENDVEVERIFKQHKVFGVIHLATDYGRESSLSQVLSTNVLMPLRLLELSESNETKIFINTDTFIAKQNSSYNYLNSYSKSKYIFKDLISSFKKSVKIINMKLEHIYGENDADTKFVTYILAALLNNVAELDLTEGTQKRDFIYVEDVVEAYITIINNYQKLTEYSEFEVGTGKSKSIRDFVERLSAILDSKTKLRFGKLPMREGEFKESKADILPLTKLGWNIKFDLDAGLKKTINFERIKLNLK